MGNNTFNFYFSIPNLDLWGTVKREVRSFT